MRKVRFRLRGLSAFIGKLTVLILPCMATCSTDKHVENFNSRQTMRVKTAYASPQKKICGAVSEISYFYSGPTDSS